MLDMITFNAMLVKIPNPKVGHSLEYFHHLITSLCQKHHSLLLLLLYYEFPNQVLEEGLGGTITSANFPGNYEHNTDCSFTIVPVPGNHVALKVNLVIFHPSSWWWRPHIAACILCWSLLSPGEVVLDQFFCKMYFLHISRSRKKNFVKFLRVLPP